VHHFEVDNLSDLVVIAGPNGVGKTRLITAVLQYFQQFTGSDIHFEIEATCLGEEKAFGKRFLNTSAPAEAQKVRTLLQQNKKRRNLTSSIVYFESNRSIQKVKPLTFQFDFPDPDKEELRWDLSFRGLANRWTDTQHAIFKKIQSQKTSIAARAIALKQKGYGSMNLDFTDPLDPFRKAFSQLLGPKTLAAADMQKQVLTYEQNGEIREISTLSSGEKEVLNITFDFLLRKPSNCVVFFDEPELHLHPELLPKLICTLKDVGGNNQFILISHSPDVISSSLNDTVVFLTPPKAGKGNQGIVVTPQDENTEALSRLGQSVGVVALGKKIVLIEGGNASLDKQTYSHILKNKFTDLVLLPSGGKSNLQTFGPVMKQVLDRSIWGVQFFMLADGDAQLTTELQEKEEITGHSRFAALGRYHLENYFLDSLTLSRCFEQMEPEGSWLRAPDTIDKKLRGIAKELLSYTASLMVSKYIRQRVGNVDVMIKRAHDLDETGFTKNLVNQVQGELTRVSDSMSTEIAKDYAAKVFAKLNDALKSSEDSWKIYFPGKPILAKFCSEASIQQGRLKTLYISQAEDMDDNPFKEIHSIFEQFSGSQ